MSAVLDPPFDPATIQTNAKLAALLAADLAIFPCHAAGTEAKRPLHGVPWKSARPGQLDRVTRWWGDHPDAMPAIHLGAVGLLVFDADGPEGIAAFEAICEPHGGVPECPMVDTPSGGRHYYFHQLPGEHLGNGRGALPPKSECKIDIRGDGGFVIAPDATREDGIYAIPDGHPLDILQAPELPDFLHDLLVSREVVTKAEEITSKHAPIKDFGVVTSPKEITTSQDLTQRVDRRLLPYVEKVWNEELERVRCAGKGGRNDALNSAAFALYQFVASGHLKEDDVRTALIQAAEACGLVKDDGRRAVLATIRSGRNGGLAHPRKIEEQMAAEEAEADTARELNRALVRSEDGTLADAKTGEVIEADTNASGHDEFPEHLTHVPGLVGALVDYICETAIFPSRMMALGAAMTMVGTAMGRNWAGPTGSSTVLFVLSLAPTGVGKDHPLQAIMTMLDLAKMGRLVGETEFTGGPAIQAQITADPLCVCPIDEIGAFLERLLSRKSSSFERQATKILRQLWSTKYGTYKTIGKAQSKGQLIYAPHLSICGASVHEEVFEALSGGDVRNGFLNRFLFLSTHKKPEAQKPKRTLLDTPHELLHALSTIYGGGAEMVQGQISNSTTKIAPRPIDWQNDAAEAAFSAFQGEVSRSANAEPEMAPYLGRTAEMAVRLATIRAMGRVPSKPQVDIGDMQWGCEVARWSAYAMARACDLYISETAAQGEANRILRIVHDLGGKCTRAMVARKLRNVLRSRDLDDTWKMLIEAQRLVEVGEVKNDKNSKSTKWFVLNDGK